MIKYFAILGLGLGVTSSALAVTFTADPMGACAKITAQSKAENTRLLIIGVEGTMQYDAKDADALFAYSQARKSGPLPGALPPLRDWGGVLTDGLLFPLLQKFGDQVDMVSFNLDMEIDAGDLEACATQWMRVPGHKLMLIGHSSGAQELVHAANELHDSGVAVDTLVTIDAIQLMGIISRPAGVAHFLNFFETVGDMTGQSVTADVNVHVRDVVGHLAAPGSATIFKDVAKQVSASLVINTAAR
jgi:hypothetical protein